MNLSPTGPLQILIDDALLKVPASQQPTCNADGLAVPALLSCGTLYSFKKTGDVIVAHTHEVGTHYTVVLMGQLIYTEFASDGSSIDTNLSGGAFILVPPGVQHGFTALNDNSACLNLTASSIDADAIKASIAALAAQAQTNIAALQSALAGVQAAATE